MRWIIYYSVSGQWAHIDLNVASGAEVVTFLRDHSAMIGESALVLAPSRHGDYGAVYRARIASNGIVDMYTIGVWDERS
jgi:hypothetical protein